MAEKPKGQYIGDGVYAHDDGYHIVLETFDGYEVTNTISLDPHVWDSLKLWDKRRRQQSTSTEEESDDQDSQIPA